MSKNEPAAWGMENDDGQIYDCITPEEHAREEGAYTVALYRGRERVVFPTMLRQMWSGGEVQAWLDEHVNKDCK